MRRHNTVLRYGSALFTMFILSGCSSGSSGGNTDTDSDPEPDRPGDTDDAPEVDDTVEPDASDEAEADDATDADTDDTVTPPGDEEEDVAEVPDTAEPDGDDEAVADPCNPNPCTTAGRTTCRVQSGAAQCVCDIGFEDDGAGGCRQIVTRIDDPLGDPNAPWSLVVRVLDERNVPLENQSVEVGDRAFSTRPDGTIRLADVPAGDVLIKVRREGYADVIRPVNREATRAGVTVSLLPVAAIADIPAGTGGALAADGVRIDFPADVFVDDAGAPQTGPVRVSMATAQPGRDAGAAVGEPTLVAPDGRPTTVEPLSRVHVTLKTPAGGSVHIREGAAASIAFPLPDRLPTPAPGAADPVRDGDRLTIASLDETTGRWREEGECRVETDAAGTRTCTGTAGHFSWWALVRKTFGFCVNVVPRVQLPARYPLVRVVPGVSRTAPPETVDEISLLRNSRVLPAAGGDAGSFCGLFPYRASGSYTLRMRFGVQMSASETDIRDVLKLVRLPAEETKALDSRNALTRFEETRRDLCNGRTELACPTVFVDVAPADVLGTLAVDADRDGYFVPTGGGALPEGIAVDCNDANPSVFPGATEVPCNGIDDGCRGVPEPAALVAADTPDAVWNAMCAVAADRRTTPWTWPTGPATACVQRSDEIPGNGKDEDCNGIVSDVDKDGYTARGDPYEGALIPPERRRLDCDDARDDRNPAASEIPHNPIDENCDGIAPDFDNDGFYSANAVPALELDGGPVKPETIGDCNDFNALQFPGSTRSESVLRSYYEPTRRSPEQRERKASFCDLFNPDGSLGTAGRALLVDYNCDGFISDADGDGFTVPGDTTKGEAYAYDCNDLDPRVRPIDASFDGRAPPCNPAFAQPVERQCTVDTGPFGSQARGACPLTPDGRRTTCVDLVDGQNVSFGVYVCNSASWAGDPALPAAYGRMWGPCATEGTLPPCGAGSQCAYSAASNFKFSAAYLDRLRREGWTIPDTASMGMCFPRCGDRCGPVNPCTEPNKGTCQLVDRQPACSCDAGYTLNARNRCVPADCGTACDNCGDGTCGAGEDTTNCPADCNAGGDADADTGEVPEGAEGPANPRLDVLRDTNGSLPLGKVIVKHARRDTPAGPVRVGSRLPLTLVLAKRDAEAFTGDTANVTVFLRPAGAGDDAEAACFVGGEEVKFEGTEDATVRFSIEIPKACLGVLAAEADVTPLIDVRGFDRRSGEEIGLALVSLDPSEAATTINQECAGLAETDPRGCATVLKLYPADRVDVVLTDFVTDGSVFRVRADRRDGDPQGAATADVPVRPTLRLIGADAYNADRNPLPGGVVLRYRIVPTGRPDTQAERLLVWEPRDGAPPVDVTETVVKGLEPAGPAGAQHELVFSDTLRTRLLSGDWAGESDFKLIVCAHPPLSDPDAVSDVCAETAVRLVRDAPVPPNNRASWDWSWGWDRSLDAAGVVSAYTRFNTSFAGGSSRVGGGVSGAVGGSVLGNDFTFLDAAINGQVIPGGRSPLSVSGRLTVAGITAFSSSQQATPRPANGYETEVEIPLQRQKNKLGRWNRSYEKCKQKLVWCYVALCDFEACAGGGGGVDPVIKLGYGRGPNEDPPFDGDDITNRGYIGAVGRVAASAGVRFIAALNLLVFRGGGEAQGVFVDVGVNVVDIRLDWGVGNNGFRLGASLRSSLELALLRAKFNLFIEKIVGFKCRRWFKCKFEWDRIGTWTLWQTPAAFEWNFTPYVLSIQ